MDMEFFLAHDVFALALDWTVNWPQRVDIARSTLFVYSSLWVPAMSDRV